MAEVTGIPRWLELAAEIDYRYFLLNEMRRQVEAEDERLTPLDRLIDEATGIDEARLAEAEEIVAEIKTLKAEWDALAEPEEGDDGLCRESRPRLPVPVAGSGRRTQVRVRVHVPQGRRRLRPGPRDGTGFLPGQPPSAH